MVWENPEILYAFWLLPLVAWLLVHAERKRRAAASRFAEPHMATRLLPPAPGPRPWLKGAALVLALACLTVAAARPRFGVYFEKIAARGLDLFVLLDVSRSMQAEDAAPNRLERAKSDIKDLIKKLPGDRVGLIAFAGAPVIRVPLTTDQGFFRLALDETDTDSAPRGGTLIGDAVRKAIASMDEDRERDQVLLLITDGGDQESLPLDAARQAAQRGIKIFAVGLGDSKDGTRIPVRDEAGGLRYVKDDEGKEVWSQMNERLLKEIAMTTGGAYIPAKTQAYDLGQIYEEYLAGLTRGEIHTEKRKRYRERFQLFVCLGLGLLIVEMLIPSYPRAEAGTTGGGPTA